jgi:23S rRNA (adenine2030-N6)-methyltransferase
VNYRHYFHAGNFADVMKHALLVGLIRALQRKPGGYVFVDTHAGRGSYRLARAKTGGRLVREPEYPDGIGLIWRRTDAPEPVSSYLDLVRAANAGHTGLEPARYPGSPEIAVRTARPQDRTALCELHPAECAALRRSLKGARRMRAQVMDGYAALRAFLPPLERRALVLIDPTYEAPGEEDRILEALGQGLERFPRGIYAVWYPLTDRFAAGELLTGLRKLTRTPCLVADLIVAPQGDGMRGCGLAVLNPPWLFEEEARASIAWLAEALAQSPGSNGSVRWLTSHLATSASGG